MDNLFIKMQINNTLSFLKAFEDSCQKAALMDDNKESFKEKILLQKIHRATEKYCNKLEKLSKE